MSNIDKLYEKSTKLQGLLEYHLSEKIVEGQHIENYKWVKAKDVTNEDIKSMDKQIILFKFFFLKNKGVFLNEEEIQFSNNKVMINNNSMTFVNFEDFLDENLKKIDNNKKNLRSNFLNLSSVTINDNTGTIYNEPTIYNSPRISDERLKFKKNARSQFVRNGNQKITIYNEPTISNSPRISHERLKSKKNARSQFIRNDTITNIKQLIKEKVSTIDIGNKNFIFDFLQNLSSHELSNFLKFLQMNPPDQVSQILEFLFKEEDLEKVEEILRFILRDEFDKSDLNKLYITLIDVKKQSNLQKKPIQRRRKFVQDNKGQIYYSEPEAERTDADMVAEEEKRLKDIALVKQGKTFRVGREPNNFFNNRDNTMDTGQTGHTVDTEQTVDIEQTGQRELTEQTRQTEIDRQKRQKLRERKRLRILRQNIDVVISPKIFKRTINTILNYLKSPLTPNHFNHSINDSKFRNLLSLLQFKEENAKKYKTLFSRDPGLVRTVSTYKDTPLQRLNIFQIVTLVILFRNYLNHKKGQAKMKEYLNSIKNGNNNSDKIIRLLYLVLIFEFNQRISIENMNKKTTYRNQIIKHYSPNNLGNLPNLGNESRKLQSEMKEIENESRELQREMEKITNALGKP